MTSKSNTEFIEKINKAYNEAWDLINTRSGWQPAKAMFLRSANLDKIEWRRRRTGGSNRKSSGIVYRVTATLPSPKEKVVALLRDVNNIASWNRTLQVWYSYIIFDILHKRRSFTGCQDRQTLGQGYSHYLSHNFFVFQPTHVSARFCAGREIWYVFAQFYSTRSWHKKQDCCTFVSAVIGPIFLCALSDSKHSLVLRRSFFSLGHSTLRAEASHWFFNFYLTIKVCSEKASTIWSLAISFGPYHDAEHP